MSRERNVYPTDRIAHLWFHKTQFSARNAQYNFYFEGDTIYSYGSHFPIARHVVKKKGQPAVLFTTRTHSITTAKHIHHVRWAIPSGTLILYTDSVTQTPSHQVARYGVQITHALQACYGPTGRFRLREWRELETLIHQANTYAEYFGFRKRWTMPEDKNAIKASIAKANKAKADAHRKALKAYTKQQAEARAKLAAKLEQWRAGEVRDAYGLHILPVALRIRGGEVETSHGVAVPVSHARRLLSAVRKVKESGAEFVANGHTIHIGHYSVSRIDAEGNVTAGCHNISWEEIERFAPQLAAAKDETAEVTA